MWAKTHLPSAVVHHCFPDIGTMLGNIKGNVTRWVDIKLKELPATKVQRSTPQLDVVVSFQTQDP